MASKLYQRPPFRAKHLGSLLRPSQLLEARAAVDKKQVTQKELGSVEDECVKQIVQIQIDLGFHPISDGEYRLHMFW